ncbi:MAG: CDP-2,3-bis-(O-geranylgeranyl)-sn-glycerol synthase [Methanocella sp.]
MLDLIILAIWLMLPAYIANPSAALFGGGKPIDLGKKFMDGKRWLGDGKTYRGLVTGTVCGMIIGVLQILLAPYIAPYLAGIVNPDQLMTWTVVAAITMPFGALLGDMIKSFFKRRIGYERGAMLPVADQLDFVAGAWALTYIVTPAWITSNFTLGIIITVILITPILHVATNVVGFKLGKKDVPW